MSHPRPRVLMVEDASPVLGVMREALDRAGLEVESAQTATEALGLLTARPYAVIVADCFLPDLAPLAWLGAARRAAPSTPFVLYSGSIRLEELGRLSAELGAVAVLEKPFSPARLVEAVQAALPKGARR